MSALRTKMELPNYYKLTKFKYDPELLRLALKKFESDFTNVLESNGVLCSANHKLAHSVYDHYEQVSLTTFNGPTKPISLADCERIGETVSSELVADKVKKYQLKKTNQTGIPELDERNYNKPSEAYLQSYFYQCTQQFKSQVTRVRLVKLKAGQEVNWHIDYDPTYAVRIIIPVITNDKVINKTNRRGVIEEVHMPADGHAWFLNPGFSHYVVNNGEEDRVVLMISLNGQDDLEEIPSAQ